MLFSADDCSGNPTNGPQLVLERNEVIALLNLLERLSNSIEVRAPLCLEWEDASGCMSWKVFTGCKLCASYVLALLCAIVMFTAFKSVAGRKQCTRC